MSLTNSYLVGKSEKYPDVKVHELFEEVSRRNANKTAVIEEKTHVTFEQLNRKANAIAASIKQNLTKYDVAGDAKDPVVCILLPGGLKYTSTVLALWKLGIAFIPFEPDLPVNRMKLIFREAKPLCFISSGEYSNIVNNFEIIGEGVMILEHAQLLEDGSTDGDGSGNDVKAMYSDTELAAILYTSGSTGTPKGVKISHKNLVNRFFWQWNAFPFKENDLIAAKTALVFVDSLTEVFGTLCKGVTIVVIPPEMTRNTEVFVNMLDKYGVTKLVTSPSQLRTVLLFKTAVNLRRLNLVVTSAEELPHEVAKDFFNAFPRGTVLANYYGSTETTGEITTVTFHSAADVDRCTSDLKVAIGQPLDNCAVFLVDESLTKVVPTGELGEILVAGPSIVDAYTDRAKMVDFIPNSIASIPDEIKLRFPKLYRTGDFGRIVDGHVIYEGRRDSQVKINGKRINLESVRLVVMNIPDVEKAVVLVCKLTDTNQKIVAFFVSNGNVRVTKEEVTSHCKDSLPAYMIPLVLEVPKIPMTTTGKTDRLMLLHMFKKSISNATGAKRNYDQATASILEVIAKCLGVSEVTLEDNFFAIGGDSLSAVTIIVQLRELGYSVDSTQFLNAKSLSQIVESIKNAKDKNDARDSETDEYSIEMLNDVSEDDQQAARSLLAECFIRKDPMTICLRATKSDFLGHLGKIWPSVAACGGSVIARNKKTGQIAGLNMVGNFEVQAPPDDAFDPVLTSIGEFLGSCDADFHEMTQGGGWWTSLIGGIDPSVPYEDNLKIFLMMEKKVVDVAKAKGASGMTSVNTHPVTSNIGEHFLGFTKLGSHKINEFVSADGTRPFSILADDVIADSMALKF
ncbi:beta-alanyl-bioamine nonribosomal peptide synthetase ebony-like [Tubulanus polymorphus]|uniref:beta-alanyl-bioamine nonribosomal peptide synthetase ebony-like n=1 Tax=Tubulanus polymorphus TaxID=672921 RepID=UPI003DA564D1